MISSVGGRNAYPFFGAYSAAKFGLEGLSESLRRELMLFGIDVVIVNPGAVSTPIWGKSERADAQFADTPYGPAVARTTALTAKMDNTGLKPERIAETVRVALTAAKPNARYVVTPTPIQDALARTLPKRMVDNVVAGQLGLKPAERG
jgi:hypothetical protein